MKLDKKNKINYQNSEIGNVELTDSQSTIMGIISEVTLRGGQLWWLLAFM